jgi:hypothetical protein
MFSRISMVGTLTRYPNHTHTDLAALGHLSLRERERNRGGEPLTVLLRSAPP